MKRCLRFLARGRVLRCVAVLVAALCRLGWPEPVGAQAVAGSADASVRAADTGVAAGVPAASAADRREFVIRSIAWTIEGRVDRAFVSAVAGIETGKAFESRRALDAYLADRAQRLYNLRLFDEVGIEPAVGAPTEAGGPEAVDLVVRLRESGTLIVLPGLSQDPTEGLVLDAMLLRYDVEGRGGELDLGLARSWPPGAAPETAGSAAYSLPFYTGPLEWQGSATAVPAVADDGRATLAAEASLGVALPLYDGGGPDQVLLVPSIAAAGDWAAAGAAALSPGLALRFGRVDWLENRRRGFLVEAGVVGNRQGVSAPGVAASGIPASPAPAAPLYSADAGFYLPIGAGGEFMGRSGALVSTGASECGLQTAVRGVDPGRLAGDAGLYANFDYWWNLGPFVFSKWFHMSWLSIFDAEVHAGPFVDVGIPRDPSAGDFDLRGGRVGTGLQVQSYALYARPFYLYTSIGVDLRAAIASGTVLGLAADGLPIAVLTSAVGVRY